MGPFVHHSFSPFTTKCVPDRSSAASVRIFAASEPVAGSVSAKAEIASFATMGRYVRFCVSLPKRRIGIAIPMDWGTATVSERMLLALAINVRTRP